MTPTEETLTEDHIPARSTYSMRRAPRLGMFLALGVLFGVIVAGVVAFAVHSGPNPPADPFTGVPLELGSTLGIASVAFGIAGAVLASLVWLLMDRRSRKATATYVLESTDDPAAADVRLHRGEVQAYRERWGTSSTAGGDDVVPAAARKDDAQ
jgi:vacuolar-type H+-ATPase subunit I/STV1